MPIDPDALARAFDEWQRRYVVDPSEFGDIAGAQDYGTACASYLLKLLEEQPPAGYGHAV